MADTAAKQASDWREHPWSPPIPPTMAIPFATLRSSIKMRLRKRIDGDWKSQRQKNTSGTKKLIKTPAKAVLRLYMRIHRALSFALIQLRTKKIGLKDYLFSIRRASSGECPCGWGRQTVKHVLIECPIYQRIRSTTIWKKSRIQDLGQLLSAPALARASAQFVTQTRLLGQFGSVPMERLED